jgi:hypothetical protein
MLESLVVVHKRMSYNFEVHQREREREESTHTRANTATQCQKEDHKSILSHND